MFTYANETVSDDTLIKPYNYNHKGISLHQEGDGYIMIILSEYYIYEYWFPTFSYTALILKE